MRSLRKARGPETGKAEVRRFPVTPRDKHGVLRITPASREDEPVDLIIDKVELRDGTLVLSASGKARDYTTIMDDDLVQVIGSDGVSLCRSWIKVYSPISASPGERISLIFPVALGNMVNTAMADHTLDVEL